jgi:hypothetical protein
VALSEDNTLMALSVWAGKEELGEKFFEKKSLKKDFFRRKTTTSAITTTLIRWFLNFWLKTIWPKDI